ncbi:MAG: hypothetical protein SFT94_02235 [Pseudanabaenaceae cyanobacterium bins.68]|nr:hypothetical protein [Pseudanabaenaceae cyanobacterium bins.68]
MTRPYVLDTKRLPIAIGYKNEGYIADLVMPYFPVDAEQFDWNLYSPEQYYEIRDTRISRTGVADMIEFASTVQTSRVFDEALDGMVPVTDREYAPAGIDPASRLVEGLTELLVLRREQRVAQTVFNAANYEAANVLTLSGGDQFNASTSDPLKVMMESLDIPLVRPNTIVFGQQTWTTVRRNPIIVEAIRGAVSGNAASQGVINTGDLANLLGVQNVYVGMARGNANNPGQAPSLPRLWGKSIALLHLSALGAGQSVMPTWGWTARYSTRFVRTWFEEEKGIKGSDVYRVGEQVREIVSAPGAGFYIQNAIA